MNPREVTLPCCEVCGHVGKQPNGNFRSFCTGPRGQMHKRTRMELRTFREVEPDDFEQWAKDKVAATGEGRR